MTSPATQTVADDVLRLERRFAAPRVDVYRAWTDPKQLVRWWGPEGMSIPDCEMDVRPGGKWRTCMTGPDGNERWVGGVYREVTPPARLVFTWAWEEDGKPGPETLITIEFHDLGDATDLVLTQEGFADSGGRDLHGEGWTSSFDCLDEVLK